ncbi:MAG: hypothetical protein V4590_11705 [Bacteroidota bacterium]
MKRLLLLFLLVAISCTSKAYIVPDSVLAKYNAPKIPYDKVRCLIKYLFSQDYSDSSFNAKALDLLVYFRKQQDEKGTDHVQLLIAQQMANTGSYVTSLQMAFPILEKFTAQQDSIGILQSYITIITAYSNAKNHAEAAAYNKKSIPFIVNPHQLGYAHTNLATTYAEAGMTDSGLVYAQQALNIFTGYRDTRGISVALSIIAQNYIARGDHAVALPFLVNSLTYARSSDIDNDELSLIYNVTAEAYLGTRQFDSVLHYARLASHLATITYNRQQLLLSYKHLYTCFDETKAKDSANKYFRLATSIRDSLYSMEKAGSMQAISFKEQLNRQEAEFQKQKAEEERQQNIQYVLLGLCIISFCILFLLLSRSIITNVKMIEIFGVMALLIVFEFMNLLLHPFLESITHHSPPLMLLALVAIAALLVPLHHRLEKWATTKLVEKNKAIRLAQAKKTIEKLGNEKI